MAVRQTDTDPLYKRLRSRAGELDALVLAVGIRDGEIASYATANEYGTDRIPARPWMATAFDQNEAKYQRMISAQEQRVLRGETEPRPALAAIGVVARTDMINSIQRGSWTPNADATIRAKGSSKPLVDTGAMQRAIEFWFE